MTLPFLAVKDFAKHQHYRDRRPPWIKLYATVLTDATFLQMPEAAQAQLIKLWILASQFGNPLPNNPRLLSGKIGCTGKFHLPALIASGFLIPCEQDALAGVEENASGSVGAGADSRESREDRGQRTDSTTTAAVPDFVRSRDLLVSILGNAVEADTFFAGLPNDTKRLSWARNLVVSIEDGNGHPIPPAVMLAALIDFNLSDRERYPYSGAVFRGFVDKAAKPKLERAAKASSDDEAQGIVTAIRKLIQTNGRSRFIPRPAVEAMGERVTAAYDALGGPERFLSVEPDKLSFLVRDFGTALRNHAA